MHKVDIALQELQAVALLQHRMVFTGKMGGLYLDNNTAKAYVVKVVHLLLSFQTSLPHI